MIDPLSVVGVVLLSALLYRWPRGGGPVDFGSFIGATIWALGTACFIAVLFADPFALVLGIPLMLGEAPKWSQWWPNRPDGGSIWKLSLRGCLLLNPFMGLFYFWFYGQRHRLRRFGDFLDGWTAYAELACGAVTASSYILVWLIWRSI